MDINNPQEQIHNFQQQIYHVQQQINDIQQQFTDTSTQIQTYILKRQSTEEELFKQNDGWYMNLLETRKDLQKEKNALLNLQLMQLQRADTENLPKRVKQDNQE
ncbi:hypothetical protein HDU92_006749, partial [Lobulomyces angularis]